MGSPYSLLREELSDTACLPASGTEAGGLFRKAEAPQSGFWLMLGMEFKNHWLSQYSSSTTIASVLSHPSSLKGTNPVASARQVITSVLPCVGQKNIDSCASTEHSVSETWKSLLARMYVLGRANVICSCSCSFLCYSLSWLPCSPL